MTLYDDVKFIGQPPTPEPTGFADPGISPHEARADHRHPIGPAEPWHLVGTAGEPGYQNSWVQAAPGVLTPTGFYKDQIGVVHLKGAAASGTVNSVIYTLPAGYRPIARQSFPVSGASGATEVYGRVDVYPNGNVKQEATTATNSRINMDGITFRAEL